MTYTLLIVESPAKCKKIESYLGDGYKCVASFGHLRELKGLDSININSNFKPTFIQSESKNKQIGVLRKMISEAKEVLLASDDDREGEAIAWHICDLFKLPLKTTKRIIFHEITESAVKKAVANPILVNMNTVNAQLARQILDLLVGYKLSPILWKNISKYTKTGLSAGRCQTPALRIIYENQKEIEGSPGTKVYNTTGYFTSKNIPFVLDYNHENEETIESFLEESLNHDHIYQCGELRNTTKQQPKPFTTSRLQQMASNEMRVSPKETMALCQKLYEGGHITYMRTDSSVYSAEFIENALNYITNEYGKEFVNKEIDNLSLRSDDIKENEEEINELKSPGGEKINKKNKDKKNKDKKNKDKDKKDDKNIQEAHEAIRPTNINKINLDKDDFTAKEIKMYLLIRRNTLESCMSPATYKGLTATISSPTLNVHKYNYKYLTEQIIFPGWKIVENAYEKINNDFTYLQTLKKGSILKYKKICSKVTMKNLKTHYTEAKLVQLLEQHGIGRPSTFSNIIDKIQERGYVKNGNIDGNDIKCVDYELDGDELSEIETRRQFGNEKNKLIIQPLGVIVLEFLLNNFNSLFEYSYTKNMEDELDLIAKGNKVWYELCGECLNEIETLSNIINDRDRNNSEENNDNNNNNNDNKVGVIKIDNEHTYMIAKYGPVIKCTKNDKVSFKQVKPDIDINKLKRGEYKLSDIIADSQLAGRPLGLYKDYEVVLKKGKYGLYIEWKGIKESIKGSNTIKNKSDDEIILEDVTDIIDKIISNNSNNSNSSLNTNDDNNTNTNENGKSVIRKINEDLSLRTGKYGDYIFYKRKMMKQPKFLKLAGFEGNYKECNMSILKKWIKETYGVS